MINVNKIKTVAFWVLWLFGYMVASHYQELDIVALFFFTLSAVSWLLNHFRKKNTCEYKTKGKLFFAWLITGYLTFSLFGRSIFMEYARIEICISKIFSFIFLTISLFPISFGIIGIMEESGKRKRSEISSNKRIILSGIACASMMLAIELLLSTSYYPCNMTTDSYGHWLVATGKDAINDYSPVAFNLLIKWLFTLFNTNIPYVYCVFQILLFSIVIGDIAIYLRYKGVPLCILMIGTVLIAICPSTFMLLTYFSKNPLSAVFCLWVTITLTEIITDPNRYLNRISWYVKAIISISGLYFTRENNVVIVIPLCCFLIWFIVKHKKEGRKILYAGVGVLCVIVLVQGVIYNTIDYIHYDKSHETVRPLLAPVGSAIQQELVLSDDVLEKVEKVLPVEEWKSRYDSFNSDIITWGNPRPQYAALSLGEGFDVYIKMLLKYPDVVIKDRLDGMDMIWNSRSEMVRYAAGLTGNIDFNNANLPTDGTIGSVLKEIKQFTRSFLLISVNDKLIDTIIWKNGLYIYLFFIVILYLSINKKIKILWSILPSLFILMTYVLVISWQMFFYIWFFPLSVTLLFIISVVECGNNKMNELNSF